jgi:anti-anti-sigma regulatory factor
LLSHIFIRKETPYVLKIVSSDIKDHARTLRLEGRVGGPWVTELRRACEQVLGAGLRLTLDLAEVSFVDRDGVMLFRDLQKSDVKLIHCSGFVVEQLKA